MHGQPVDNDSPDPRSDDDWRPAFLADLATTGNVSAACLAAGVSRHEAFAARRQSPAFRAEWDGAIQVSVEALEAHIRERAAAGPADPASGPLARFLRRAERRRGGGR